MTQIVPSENQPPEKPGARALAVRGANALRFPVARDDMSASENEDDGIDLRVVLRIVLKYKWMLLAFALVSGLIAAVQSLRSTPMYRTAATVQIEKAAQRVVAFGADVDAEQAWLRENAYGGLTNPPWRLEKFTAKERYSERMG